MKRITFFSLLICCLYFTACQKDQSEAVAIPEVQEHQINLESSYDQLEAAIVTKAGDDLKALYAMYVSHIQFVADHPKFKQEDIDGFIAEVETDFSTVIDQLNAGSFLSGNVLAELEKGYDQIADWSDAEAVVASVNAIMAEINHQNLDMAIMILEGYNLILKKDYLHLAAEERDCMSDCRNHNVYYLAYYTSYNQYLADCGYPCYNEAAGYAHDCGILACMQFCS